MRTRRLNPFFQLLGLSATLGNRAELAEWLGGVSFGSSWKPIPIEWRYVRFQRAIDKPRILIEEIKRCVTDGGQSLVFVQSRRRAEALSAELSDAGVPTGHHHAGLDSNERRGIESEFRNGGLLALVSTGTLEMGLNLPARQVVLYDLQSFDGANFIPLSVNTVWQRAGRAGRPGLDTRGEIVLIAPAWDRGVDRYSAGKFEKITSGLGETPALAEQVLAEVGSGLARTRAQLTRNLQQSLAAHQRRLPTLDKVVDAMRDSGMLVEVPDKRGNGLVLKPTRLGRVAVRQMLEPSTVSLLAEAFRREDAKALTFFDVILLCVLTDDCEPLIPADFEELGQLGQRLAQEPSTLLGDAVDQMHSRFGLSGRRLLAVIKTALIVRAWTRIGDTESVAASFGCYAFEIRRLSESVERILAAAAEVLRPPRETTLDASVPDTETPLNDAPPLAERVSALSAMVAHGVDEETVTLTYIDGLGGTLARRLHQAGIANIEDLALSEPRDLADVRGISPTRAARWIEEATDKVKERSAFALRETGPTPQMSRISWSSNIDPYRLRRALDLETYQDAGDYVVSGGLEPHRITSRNARIACDCGDFANGQVCKHILAIRLRQKDAELLPLVESISSQANNGELDLFQLWFDRGKR